MVKPFQHFHYCSHDNPIVITIQQDRLQHQLIKHCPGLHRHPRLHQNFLNYAPPPLRLPQFVINGLPITVTVRYGAAQIWECVRCLQGVQIDFYGHLTRLKAPL